VFLLIGLLRLLARLPMRFHYAMGSPLGWLAYLTSHRYRRRLRENLRKSGVWSDEADYRRILRANIVETGRQAAEFIPLWYRDAADVRALVRSCEGEQAVMEAHRQGRSIVLLTTHLGCFEVAAIYAAFLVPLTVLYRTPHIPWVSRLVVGGRARSPMKLAPATVQGVRMLFRALKQAEAIGILPDQVPGHGEGVWVRFFGRPAYTMTLLGRLCASTDPAVFVAFAKRLPRAAGYEIELEVVDADLAGKEGAQHLNDILERTIRTCPEQYLWGYNRYKHPAGAPPPPEGWEKPAQ
jgi:Kdo2-lipid IVA lauroyltransferase/acyltransferase